jgi:AmmeMemoRadiSam system protein B
MCPQAIRPPAVAGRFYPSGRKALIGALDAFAAQEVQPQLTDQNAVACVVPHAGYIYSGRVAASVYSRLPHRPLYVILGPNHFGWGRPLATLTSNWLTPLGEVVVDPVFADALINTVADLADDPVAHQSEHSLEVQLPFLQYFAKDFTFVPIAIGAVSYDVLHSLGTALARLIRSDGRPILLVASSDMNHYEPDDVTRVKDHKAIERILALDPRGLAEVIDREQISMCGYAPAIAMLTAAQELGAHRGELVRYATSADAGGDPEAVVGYAGIIID